jgi:uncharacterized protein (TIGR02246 family)
MKPTKVALALALVPFLGLLACSQEGQQEGMEMGTVDMEALTAEMSQLEAEWKQAYEAGDAATLASFYTDDAIYMAPYTGAIHGRAAIQTRMAETMGAMTDRQITIERTDAGASGDLAYGIGTYNLQMGMEGMDEPLSDSGKYVTISKRDADGSWKIYAHIWNTSMSEAEVMQMLSTMSEMSGMSEMSEMDNM